MTADIEVRRRRALYRATHRGTKEMDFMIGRYAAHALPALDGIALDRFEQFLALPDPMLNGWLLAPASSVDGGFTDIVGDMRAFHGLEDGRGASD